MPASSQPPYGITPWSTPQTTTPPSRGHWRMLPGKPGPPSKTGHSICQFVQGVIPLPTVDEGSEASPISTETWVIIEAPGILSTMKELSLIGLQTTWEGDMIRPKGADMCLALYSTPRVTRAYSARGTGDLLESFHLLPKQDEPRVVKPT